MVDSKVKDAINTHGDNKIPPGMLSSPHIRYCVRKYDIIQNFDDSCMGPATYHMRIGGKVLTWESGKKVEYILGEVDDEKKSVRKKVILKPNSLTFITTIEKFNLPKDIIARFNLKSKWVHQGILLGTGPIVDPELLANLLIPLHNFSSQEIEIEYNKQIISVEFTKTSNPDDILNHYGENLHYKSNQSRVFDFDGYRDRISQKKVESSVSSTFQKYDKDIKKYRDRLRFFSISSFIAIIAAFIGLTTLVITTCMFIRDARQEVDDARSVIESHRGKIDKNNDVVLGTELLEIQKQLNELREIQKNVKIDSEAAKNGELDKYLKRIDQLEGRVRQIENRMNKNK